MALGEKSFFWDKPSGDLTEDELAYYQYAAQDLASFFECLYTTGIAPQMAVSSPEDNPEDYIGSSLAVTAGTALQVVVSPGVGMIKGRGYIASLPIQLSVAAGETTDIVLRMDLQNEKPEIYVAAKQREGNASLENNLSHESLNYELALATVVVPEKSTAVTASMITDQRLNTNAHPTDGEPLAGLMKSIPGVDTKGIWEDYTNLQASINNQWNSFLSDSSEEFNTWFETAQSVISEDAAGELLNLITELQSSKTDKIDHRLKTYTDISQIGLTAGSETIESICEALPDASMLIYPVGRTNNVDIYPKFNSGTVQAGLMEVVRLNHLRIVMHYVPKVETETQMPVEYIGMAYQDSGVWHWSGWTADAPSVNGFTFAVANKEPTSAPAGRITFVYEA